jgi:hypothetical protein
MRECLIEVFKQGLGILQADVKPENRRVSILGGKRGEHQTLIPAPAYSDTERLEGVDRLFDA